jgi:periplasmic divalent cation tolerance protein
MNSKITIAYCTFPSEQVAHDICERLVTEGTIACANIFGDMKSIYRWNNQLMKENECAAILKTSVLKQEALKERIRAIHPYALPALVFLPVEGGNPDFLNWVYGQSL